MSLDKKLNEIIEDHDAVYSRYANDIDISSNKKPCAPLSLCLSFFIDKTLKWDLVFWQKKT